MSVQLSVEQVDAVTELLNIGVGRAAASMSEMIDQHIELAIPHVTVGHISELLSCIEQSGDVSIIEQRFSGRFNGMSALMFPTESAQTMVYLLMGEEIPDSASSEELEMERESVLTEIGNVLINCLMGSLGNILEEHLDYKLPQFTEQPLKALCDVWAEQADGMLIAEVQFSVADANISGRFMVIFEVGSLEALQQCLTGLLQ